MRSDEDGKRRRSGRETAGLKKIVIIIHFIVVV